MTEYSSQYKQRKKYQRIRCPKCNGTSRILQQETINKVPGLQTRQCSNKGCNHIFIYDYVLEADSQFKFWKGVLPK